MRAQCCICADLFVTDGTDIAATPCGHVFHGHCLGRWLATSSSCPSCRKNVNHLTVIPKLFFDIAEDENKEGDADKLSNEVQSLRTQVTELQQEKSKSKTKEKELKEKLKKKDDEVEGLGVLLRREQDTVAALQRMLKQLEAQKREHENERVEFMRAKRKLTELTHVEALVSGGERDAEAILQQYSSGDKNGLQQLARYCSIIKREYEQAKVEKKTLKEQLEKHKKSNYNLSRELSEAKSEVIALQEQLTRSEDDLKQLEKTNTVLTAKYNKLKYSRRHVAENSASFMSTPEAQQPPQDKTERVFETTPRIGGDLFADGGSASTPKMSKPDSENFINFDEDPPKFSAASPDLFADSPATQVRKACEQNNVKTVKLSSAALSKAPKRIRTDCDDQGMADPFPLSALNIMKKRQISGQLFGKTIVRKDYDGLGTTSKFTQALGPPKFALPRSMSGKSVHRTKLGSKKPNPSLPTLDSFVDLT
ncbi:hypothetical protein BaRGS_00021060 [Batillaria attramentaria]|uniref:RING-type domain-containing protein n=1 Tax=Batillaria attramentaria TaxID=370345 RepID=A0ABD0KKX5_9CAEN